MGIQWNNSTWTRLVVKHVQKLGEGILNKQFAIDINGGKC